MKKPSGKAASKRTRVTEVPADDILPEYDFRDARPNPYAARFRADTVVVVLAPDVARVFPDAQSVNDALRALARIAARQPGRPRAKRRTA
jgi:hypothetical protein